MNPTSIRSFVAAVVLLSFCDAFAATGSMVLNGGFEAGIQFWKGDGKIVTLADGNKIFEVAASKSRMKDLSQDFKMGELQEVEIVFRARSLNYNGPGIRIAVRVPGGGSMLFNKRLPEDGSWADVQVRYTRTTAREDRRTLIISTLLGAGEVQIDNVEVRERSIFAADRRTPEPATPQPQSKPSTVATTLPPNPPKVAAPEGNLSIRSAADLSRFLGGTEWSWGVSVAKANSRLRFLNDGTYVINNDAPAKWRALNAKTVAFENGSEFTFDADHSTFEGSGPSGKRIGKRMTPNR